MIRLAAAAILLAAAYAFAWNETRIPEPPRTETVPYCLTPAGFAWPCRDVNRHGSA